MESYKSQIKDELAFIKEDNDRLSHSISKIKRENRGLKRQNRDLLEKIEDMEALSKPTLALNKMQELLDRKQALIEKQDLMIEELNEKIIEIEKSINTSNTQGSLLQQLDDKAKKNSEKTVSDESSLSMLVDINDEVLQVFNEFGLHTLNDLAVLPIKNLQLLKQILPEDAHKMDNWVDQAKEEESN